MFMGFALDGLQHETLFTTVSLNLQSLLKLWCNIQQRGGRILRGFATTLFLGDYYFHCLQVDCLGGSCMCPSLLFLFLPQAVSIPTYLLCLG